MLLRMVRSAGELRDLVEEVGFLPFFRNEIPGFSVEECTPPELWFSDVEEGPWEWKGPVARYCPYGKLFQKKAGFVSLEWFPELVNYRRDGYDFDARFDDELASFKDKGIYDAVEAHGSLLTGDLKQICHYQKGGNTGFETVITRLQMQTYVIIADFEYKTDKHGQTYGWGVARYSTPEAQFGKDLIRSGYQREPSESKEKIRRYLSGLLPHGQEADILRMIG